MHKHEKNIGQIGESALKVKHFLKRYLLLILMAALITVTSTVNKQSFLQTLPTLISLVVQLLLVTADRRAFLLGGLNAILYAVSYSVDGVYFSAISALLISSPIQLFSFFHWKKNSEGKTVHLTLLGARWLAGTVLLILLGWAGVYFGLARFFADATLPLLDTLIFTLGIAVTLLSAFRFVESQYISLVSCMLTLALWCIISAQSPASLNYVIISVYNLYRVIQATVHWTAQYRASKVADAQA